MNTGLSLVALAEKVDTQSQLKRDYIADTRNIQLSEDALSLSLNADAGRSFQFSVTDHTHRQIGERLGIPAKFYDRLRTGEHAHPDILADAVNKLFQREPEKRLVRTLDTTARAFLSNRYRIIDNDVVLAEALKALQQAENATELRVASSQVTESRLYLKVVFPDLQEDVKRGDPIRAGVLIQNSEIGLGSYLVAPFIERLICTNGLVAKEFGQYKPHIGRNTSNGDDSVRELYTDETKKADDKALLLKLRDTILGVTRPEVFGRILEKSRKAAGDALPSDVKPDKLVEVISETYSLTKDEGGSVLSELIKGADLSRWGFVNAVTATAGTVGDYDRSTELEAFGGRLLSNDAEWQAFKSIARN